MQRSNHDMENITLYSLSDDQTVKSDEDVTRNSGPNRCENSSFSESVIKDDTAENEMPTLCCDAVGCFRPKKPMTKMRALKNIMVISVAFVMYDIAFVGIGNLQSTMNNMEDLGVNALIVSNISFLISVMFVPMITIERFGCKFNMVVTILMCTLCIAANLYPHLGTFIPAAIIGGLGEATLWAANGTYLAKLSFIYASYVTESSEVVVAKFFGYFQAFLQSAGIWSSLISYYALKPGIEEEHIVTNETLLTCGANFCNLDTAEDSNPNRDPPTDEKRYLITTIFLCCAVVSALILAFFLDPLSEEQEHEEKKYNRVQDLLKASLKHAAKRKQLLMILITIYLGLQRAFYNSIYTEAFVGCVGGVHYVGYITICFGVVSTITSYIIGPLVKYLSRPPIILLAAIGNAISFIYLLIWIPTKDEPAILFAIAGVFGFGDGVWWVFLEAIYSIYFKDEEEAAFSNFYLWNSIGFTTMYLCSNYLCVPVTIYIVLICLVVGIAGYLIAEMKSCCGKEFPFDVDKSN